MPKMAFFGNSLGWEVYAIDLTADPMRVARIVRTALGPYPVDEVSPDTVFAITRGAPSVTVIDIPSLSPLGDIPLSHKPRSASRHPAGGLAVVSGADRPRTSVIDLVARRVRLTVGVDAGGTVSGFGGSLASGHERWLPDRPNSPPRFFVLDRVHRTVAVYLFDATGTKLWETPTPSPVHHVLPDEANRTWYALCEGRPRDGVPPSVLPITETADNTFAVGAVFPLPVSQGDIPMSGGHHLDVKGNRLFAGSNEGNLYVFDKAKLGGHPTVVPTGAGCGHARFTGFDGAEYAVTVNHTDGHVTLVDVTTAGAERRVADIPVSVGRPRSADDKTQGHTTMVYPDAPHLLYVMASLDACLREVDLRTRSVRRSLQIVQDAGPVPPLLLQGHFGSYDLTGQRP